MERGGTQAKLALDDVHIDIGDLFSYDITVPNEGGSIHEPESSCPIGEDTGISSRPACHEHKSHFHTQHS